MVVRLFVRKKRVDRVSLHHSIQTLLWAGWGRDWAAFYGAPRPTTQMLSVGFWLDNRFRFRFRPSGWLRGRYFLGVIGVVI